MTEAPTGWGQSTLAEIMRGGLFTDGDWIEAKDQDPAGNVRLTQLADVGVGTFRDRSDRWLREDQAARLGCTFLAPGDVLIARMPDPIGRACLVPDNIGRAVTAVDVAVLRPADDSIDRRYLMWGINSPAFRRAVTALQSGTTRKRISRRNLASLKLPIPPPSEQRRIADLIEDLLSRLDAGNALLEATTRRTQSLRLRELASLAPVDAPTSTLGQLAKASGYGTSTKCIVGGPGAPVVRIPNLKAGRIDLTDEKRAADASVDLTPLLLEQDDLLIVRTNGSRDLIGRSAVVQSGVTASFASYLIRFRLDTSTVRPHWVRIMLNTPQIRAVLETMAASSAGQYNLGLSKLNAVSIPCPPLEEQDRLIARHEEQEWRNDALANELRSSSKKSQSLRQAVLAAAFSGRLSGASTIDIELSEEMASV